MATLAARMRVCVCFLTKSCIYSNINGETWEYSGNNKAHFYISAKGKLIKYE
jgi:hypothetical protein